MSLATGITDLSYCKDIMAMIEKLLYKMFGQNGQFASMGGLCSMCGFKFGYINNATRSESTKTPIYAIDQILLNAISDIEQPDPTDETKASVLERAWAAASWQVWTNCESVRQKLTLEGINSSPILMGRLLIVYTIILVTPQVHFDKFRDIFLGKRLKTRIDNSKWATSHVARVVVEAAFGDQFNNLCLNSRFRVTQCPFVTIKLAHDIIRQQDWWDTMVFNLAAFDREVPLSLMRAALLDNTCCAIFTKLLYRIGSVPELETKSKLSGRWKAPLSAFSECLQQQLDLRLKWDGTDPDSVARKQEMGYFHPSYIEHGFTYEIGQIAKHLKLSPVIVAPVLRCFQNETNEFTPEADAIKPIWEYFENTL